MKLLKLCSYFVHLRLKEMKESIQRRKNKDATVVQRIPAFFIFWLVGSSPKSHDAQKGFRYTLFYGIHWATGTDSLDHSDSTASLWLNLSSF